jgi:hypothetical protein
VPLTVTPADIKHRQEFKDFVIAHADAVYKPILRQLYGLWEAYTKELLKEPMVPPYIMLSSPSRPQALGDFKGLHALREMTGNRLTRGVVLYAGAEAVSFGSDLFALPLASLWRPLSS